MEGFCCPEAGINTPLTGKKSSFSHEKLPEWSQNYDGDMICCIKVLRFHFKWWGLQTPVEEMVTKNVYPKIFCDSHRKLISTAKEWFLLTMDDMIKRWDDTAQKQKEDDNFVRVE